MVSAEPAPAKGAGDMRTLFEVDESEVVEADPMYTEGGPDDETGGDTSAE